jgi:hypothetical protein
MTMKIKHKDILSRGRWSVDDFWLHEETKHEILLMRARKKVCSYSQIIPSEDFTTDSYLVFLEYASPKELAEDIITESTFQKISPIG